LGAFWLAMKSIAIPFGLGLVIAPVMILLPECGHFFGDSLIGLHPLLYASEQGVPKGLSIASGGAGYLPRVPVNHGTAAGDRRLEAGNAIVNAKDGQTVQPPAAGGQKKRLQVDWGVGV
jgi:hypothetical protein